MRTDRSLGKLILLSLITFGIYGIYFEYTFARDMNIVCEGIGKRTRGVLEQIIFGILTMGIYNIVWLYGVGERINGNCFVRGLQSPCDGSALLLWNILGAFIFVGPFVAMHKRIEGLNRLCAYHNAHGNRYGSPV